MQNLSVKEKFTITPSLKFMLAGWLTDFDVFFIFFQFSFEGFCITTKIVLSYECFVLLFIDYVIAFALHLLPLASR